MLLINTTRAKDSAYNDLQREIPGPGFIHLPEWLPESTLAELAAEKREHDGWHKVGKTNETWDLLVYADAVWRFEKGERIDWGIPPSWAQEMATNVNVISEKQRKTIQEQANEPAPKKNWINSPRQSWIRR